MPAIQFEYADDRLLLVYAPEDPGWVARTFQWKDTVSIRRTFTFDSGRLLSPDLGSVAPDDPKADDGEFVFVLGHRDGEYFRVDPRVVNTKNSFYLHDSMRLAPRHFIAHRNISVLRSIDRLVAQDVYIGGDHPEAMPVVAFESMLDQFPNSYELTRYAEARVGASIEDYLETASNTAATYEKYMNRRVTARSSDVLEVFRSHELAKFQTLKDKLDSMLANEAAYNERGWQNEILDIIRLLYPKYILVFAGTRVPDSSGKQTRQLDLMLVDSSGHIDLIEIKRPFDNCIVSGRPYRDNYPPARELTGAVMQLEKYILHLNKWGQRGEDELNRRYASSLPSGLRIRITNPKGIVIMGRDHNLSARQRADFEVIKRKYSNVIDIITYDDLLSRLGHVIDQLRRAPATP